MPGWGSEDKPKTIQLFVKYLKPKIKLDMKMRFMILWLLGAGMMWLQGGMQASAANPASALQTSMPSMVHAGNTVRVYVSGNGQDGVLIVGDRCTVMKVTVK